MDKRKMKVLVVDDEKSVRDFFGEFLKKKNAEVEFSRDGKGALDEAMKSHYDLIFMDIVLPEIHGVQAYEKIKEFGKKVPVVMMTGYAVEGLVERAKKDGIKYIIHKPFTLKEVEAVFSEAGRAFNNPSH
jgi:CheY-like chemotaxis protein